MTANDALAVYCSDGRKKEHLIGLVSSLPMLATLDRGHRLLEGEKDQI